MLVAARRLLLTALVATLVTMTVAVVPDVAVATPTPSTPTPVTADSLPTWQVNGVVWSQAVVGTTVYATGSFTKARPPGTAAGDPSEVDAGNIFAFDIRTGNPVPFPHSLNAQGLVVRASPDGSRVYVGGDFTTVNGMVRNHVAAFDTATGSLVSDFAPNVEGQVRAFSITTGTVYVGGNFRSAGGQPRGLLAAFTPSGRLLPWNPSVNDGYVWSMTLAPDASRVIVGGSFTTLNGEPAYGMGAIDAASGELLPWAANQRIRTAGDNGGITALTTDGVQVYGSGYAFGAGATFEGTFAADPYTGEIKWVNDCLGDTYDVFPQGQVLYSVAHAHDCSVVGGFPDTNPRARWMEATASSTFPTGMITRKNAYGWDFTGLPYAGMLHWWPDVDFGTVTSSRQAAWSVVGNDDYVVLGGEFPRVNKQPQQGLTRFVRRPLAPDAMKPVFNSGFVPTVVPTGEGTVKVTFRSLWDRDDQTLFYDIFRNGGPKVATLTVDGSTFWKLPMVTFTDTGQAVGSSVRYQVRARDAKGNFQWSAWSPTTTVTAAAPSTYAASVAAGGAAHLWRMSETSGSLIMDQIGDAHGASSGVTLGADGALANDADKAIATTATARVTTSNLYPADPSLSVEAWVKTTSVRGGRIVGFGLDATGTSPTGTTDRVLYLDNTGRVNFAINDGSYRTVTSRTGINDGQWHHVVGSIDAEGLQLFVDGVRVARDQRYTAPRVYEGYWRIGADQTSGFTNRPTDAGLAGSIDEVAVYPRALSVQDIQTRFVASGRTATWPDPPSDTYGAAVLAQRPDIFWRLGGSSGNAVDSSGSGATGTVSGGVTRGAGGAVDGDSAATFDGSSGLTVGQQQWVAPTRYSAELWFRTKTTRGGKLVGFGSASSGLSSSYDRHVYMYNDGRLSFGVFSGSQTSLVTRKAYNDDAWHHLVATQGPEGMRLWVDSELVGSNSVSGAQAYTGFWRVGGDRTWGSASSSYFAGTLDEVAIYPRALTEQEVRDHFAAAGRPPVNRAPVPSFSSTSTYLDVDFDASASTDADGDDLSYAWSFGDGTNGVGATTRKAYAEPGTYSVALTVTDAKGLTSTLTREITVVANRPPVADFTPTATGLRLAVDATATSDTDGSIVSYEWDFGDGGTATGPTAGHEYSDEGTYLVTLTVTDDMGAQGTASRSVTVAPPQNEAPGASFTVVADALSVTVDGGASVDPDGTITSYAWDFGDGQTATGPTATVTYATSGTYTIRLTVADDTGDTGTSTEQVVVQARNVPPNAGFAVQSAGLRASFDASTSTDTDGMLVSYVWDFGDGATGGGATAARTYAAPGAYVVTLTVTDDRGASDSEQQVVTVTAPPPLARDEFARSVTGGWGVADVGGPWSITTGTTRWSVVDGSGRLSLSAAAGSMAMLNGVSSTRTDTALTFSTDKVANGGGQFVSLIGRRVGTDDYRAKLQITATGVVNVWAARTVGGAETLLASRTISGLTYSAGSALRIRLQVVGEGSTDVRVKVWNAASPEPASWTVAATDSTPALQLPGSVGVHGYLSGSATNAPVVQSFDALTTAAVSP